MKKCLTMLMCLVLVVSVLTSLNGCVSSQNILGQTYTLTITSNSNPDSGDVNIGFGSHVYKRDQVVTLTAVPSPGNGLVSWGGDIGGSSQEFNSTITVQMSGNKNIQVNFLPVYSLTLLVNYYGSDTNLINSAMVGINVASIGGGGPTQGYVGPIEGGSSTHEYFESQEITVTATGMDETSTSSGSTAPDYGIRFTGWTGGIVGVGSGGPGVNYGSSDTHVWANSNFNSSDPTQPYTSQTIIIHMAGSATVTANFYGFDSTVPVAPGN